MSGAGTPGNIVFSHLAALGGISGVALPGNISANGVAGGVVVEGLEGVRVELFSIDLVYKTMIDI